MKNWRNVKEKVRTVTSSLAYFVAQTIFLKIKISYKFHGSGKMRNISIIMFLRWQVWTVRSTLTTARESRVTMESASTRLTATSVCVNPDTQVSQCVCVCEREQVASGVQSLCIRWLRTETAFPNWHTHTGVLYINATARAIPWVTLFMLHLKGKATIGLVKSWIRSGFRGARSIITNQGHSYNFLKCLFIVKLILWSREAWQSSKVIIKKFDKNSFQAT